MTDIQTTTGLITVKEDYNKVVSCFREADLISLTEVNIYTKGQREVTINKQHVIFIGVFDFELDEKK